MTEAPRQQLAEALHRPHVVRRGVLLIAAGGGLTIFTTAAVVRRPQLGLGLLAVFVLCALLVLNRQRIARLRIHELLLAGAAALPLLALLGPSFALPALPQLFAFRLMLVAVAVVGLTYLVVRREPLVFAAKDVALPIVLWLAWLFVGLLWAPDKLVGLNYSALVVTMSALMVATAAAGGTRRRLLVLATTLVIGYASIVGFTVLEAWFGLRFPTSRLVASNTYAVTSVFHNQNDLATYLAICWPFMLCAFFFTRRPLWLGLDLLFIVIGAAALVRTGSRSSLLAVSLSSIAAVALFSHLGSRLPARAGRIAIALIVVAFVAGLGHLLFNDSESNMLRQFRLEALIEQSQAGSGSGAIRTSLTGRGLLIAGQTHLLGAGPGQAEGIVTSGLNGLSIGNLHNWWLETYVNGGLPGFCLHLIFFLLLMRTLWPIARRDRDPFLRYLASGTFLSLIGFTVGALGPSSSVGLAPMWILYGLGLAVISRSRLAAAGYTPDLVEVRQRGSSPTP